MKAKLIDLGVNDLRILCNNGDIIDNVTRMDLSRFLFKFKTIEDLKNSNEDCKKWNIEYPDMSLYPGYVVAYVLDSSELVINDFTAFEVLMESKEIAVSDLITVQDFAALHNKSIEQVKVYCRKNRLNGVRKIGRDWLIPCDADWPLDGRTKEQRRKVGRS